MVIVKIRTFLFLPDDGDSSLTTPLDTTVIHIGNPSPGQQSSIERFNGKMP